MARALHDASPASRRVLEECEATLPGLLTVMWEGPAEELTRTENAQPALLAAGVAAIAAYREAGGRGVAYAAGHSLGEFTALVAAGALRLADALRLVRARGQAMQCAVPVGAGAMAAVVKTDAAHVARVCAATDGVVEVANLNSPQQTVISGEADAVARASAQLRAEGARAIPLKVSAPFHCSLMRPAADSLAPLLDGVALAEPSLGVVCNVTAELLPAPEAARELLLRQVTEPVRWVETLQKLQALGVTRFLEFGGGAVLTGLVERTLPGLEALRVDDPETLSAALAGEADTEGDRP
jgi:[acyl-carrier-protein] S-malonyltransferase